MFFICRRLSFLKFMKKESDTDTDSSTPPSLDGNLPRKLGEPRPPWVEFPNQPPWWGGFRQSYGEVWLHNEFLPFWHTRTAEQRQDYLTRWPAPDDEWHEYIGFGYSFSNGFLDT
jgi:hypothetical protein